MKFLKIFLSSVFILSGEQSISQVTFQKTYGGTERDQAMFINHTNDGGYILTGWTNSFGAGGFDVYLLKLDSIGNLEWTKTFGGIDNEVGNYVMQTSDNGFIVGGSTQSFGTGLNVGYLIKTDSLGNLLWSKALIGTTPINSLVEVSDGYFIAFNGGIIKINSSGNYVYNKSGIPSQYLNNTSDNGFILTGNLTPAVNLTKTDSSMNVLWSKNYSFNFTSVSATFVKESAEGGFLITGDSYNSGMFFIKTDSIGNLIWNKRITMTQPNKGYSVKSTIDGGYIISGRIYNGWSDLLVLIKLDNNGDLLWHKRFGSFGGDEWGYSMLETGDGGYIMAGFTFGFGLGLDDIFLVKSDSSGISGCNEDIPNVTINTNSTTVTTYNPLIASPTIAFTNPPTVVGSGGNTTTSCFGGLVTSMSEISLENFNIYPNPAYDKIFLEFESKVDSNFLLNLKDITGRIIKSERFRIHKGPNEFTFEISEIDKGAFFLDFFNNDRKFVKKVIIN